MALLEIRDLVVSYGAIKAVKGISLDVDKGELDTLIGTRTRAITRKLKDVERLDAPDAGKLLDS